MSVTFSDALEREYCGKMKIRVGRVDDLIRQVDNNDVRINYQSRVLPQKQSIAARILLSKLLGLPIARVLSPDFIAVGSNGKPYLSVYPKLFLSISHSYQYVAVAVNTRPIGIDIEKRREIFPYLKIKNAFTEPELSFLKNNRSNAQGNLALKLWTIKESVLKLDGVGLFGNPRTVRVDVPTLSCAKRSGCYYELEDFSSILGYIGTISRLLI